MTIVANKKVVFLSVLSTMLLPGLLFGQMFDGTRSVRDASSGDVVTCYTSGSNVEVTIEISAATGDSSNFGSWTVDDGVPDGWSFVSATDNGQFDAVGDRVSWTATGNPPNELRYVLTPASTGTAVFSVNDIAGFSGGLIEGTMVDTTVVECADADLTASLDNPANSELNVAQNTLSRMVSNGSNSGDFTATFNAIGAPGKPELDLLFFRVVKAQAGGPPWNVSDPIDESNSPTFTMSNDGWLQVDGEQTTSTKINTANNFMHTFNIALANADSDSPSATISWVIPTGFIESTVADGEVYIMQMRIVASGAFDTSGQSLERLLGVNQQMPEIFPVDPADGGLGPAVAYSQAGTHQGTTGLARHPETGLLYAIFRPQDRNATRVLGLVNPNSGEIDTVGDTGQSIADIAFGADGTLYGISGTRGQGVFSVASVSAGDVSELDGGDVPTVVETAFSTNSLALSGSETVTVLFAGDEWLIEDNDRAFDLSIDSSTPNTIHVSEGSNTLYSISLNDGSVTALVRIDDSPDAAGKALAFNDSDGLLYHAFGFDASGFQGTGIGTGCGSGVGSGNNLDNRKFKSIDISVDPPTVTDISISGDDFDEPLAMAYDTANNDFILSATNENLELTFVFSDTPNTATPCATSVQRAAWSGESDGFVSGASVITAGEVTGNAVRLQADVPNVSGDPQFIGILEFPGKAPDGGPASGDSDLNGGSIGGTLIGGSISVDVRLSSVRPVIVRILIGNGEGDFFKDFEVDSTSFSTLSMSNIQASDFTAEESGAVFSGGVFSFSLDILADDGFAADSNFFIDVADITVVTTGDGGGTRQEIFNGIAVGDALAFDVLASETALFRLSASGEATIITDELDKKVKGLAFSTQWEETVSWAFNVNPFQPVVANDDNDSVDAAFSVVEDSTNNVLPILANDQNGDENIDPTSIAIISQPRSDSTLSIDGGGTVRYSPAPDFFGTDTFTYTVNDAGSPPVASNEATVMITVTNVNDDPIASNDDFGDGADSDEDSAVTFNVLTNDFDVDGDTIIVIAVDDSSASGSATFNANGNVTYNPDDLFESLDDGESDTDVLTYTISDQAGGTAMATITVTINGVNDAPVADDETASTDEESVVTTPDVLDGDTDIEGDTLSIDSFDSVSAGGAAVAQNGNAFDYDPNGQFESLAQGGSTQDTFNYLVSDGDLTDEGQVTVTVSGVNDAPTAVDRTITVTTATSTGSPTIFDLEGDDVDDGHVLTIEQLSTLVRVGGNDASTATTLDATLTGLSEVPTPVDTAATGSAAFSNWNRASDTIDLSVTFSNLSSPVVGAHIHGAAGPTETASVVLNLLVDSPALTNAATDVTLSTSTGGAITATWDYSGCDTSACNGLDASGIEAALASGQLYVNIHSQNHAGGEIRGQIGLPLRGGESFTFNDGSGVEMEPGDRTADGAVDGDVYQFSYRVVDEHDADSGQQLVTMNAVDNRVPNAVIDNLTSTDEDTAVVTENVLSNDSDDDGDDFTIVSPVADITLASAGGGIVVLNTSPANTFTYDPNGQFEFLAVGETTTDSFTYTIRDDNNGEATGTVEITINGVNDDPIAADDDSTDGAESDEENEVLIDVLANDNDPDTSDNPNLTVTALEIAGLKGDITISNNGDDVTYNPNGQFESLDVGETDTDTFGYTVSDGNGGSDTATVTVTINGVNDLPIAVDDTDSTDEDTLVSVSVLGNDDDPDDSDRNILVITAFDSTGSTAGISINGSAIDYDPSGRFDDLDIGESETVSFTYTISDDSNAEATASVTVTINGVNDAPTAVDDDESTTGDAVTDEDTATTIDVLENDLDPDDQGILTASLLSDAGISGGTLTDNGNGTFTFDPAGDFETLDVDESDSVTFTYTASDDNGATSTATVTITIDGVSDAPVASAFNLSVKANNSDTNPKNTVDAPLFATDIDASDTVDSGTIVFRVTRLPEDKDGGSAGDLRKQGGGSVAEDESITVVDLPLIFEPAAGARGLITFDYLAEDDSGLQSAEVTINITVGAPPWFPFVTLPASDTTLDSEFFNVQVYQGISATLDASLVVLPDDATPPSGSGSTASGDVFLIVRDTGDDGVFIDFGLDVDGIDYGDLDNTHGGNGTAIHVHNGGPSERGPIIIDLQWFGDNHGTVSTGTDSFSIDVRNAELTQVQGSHDTGLTPAEIVDLLNTNNTYVTVHDDDFPTGALRANLWVDTFSGQSVVLDGPTVVVPSDTDPPSGSGSTATGETSLLVYDNGGGDIRFDFDLAVDGIAFNTLDITGNGGVGHGGNGTAVHIHQGGPTDRGGIIIDVEYFATETVFGSVTETDTGFEFSVKGAPVDSVQGAHNTGLTPIRILDLVRQGHSYITVHDLDFPTGAIRANFAAAVNSTGAIEAPVFETITDETEIAAETYFLAGFTGFLPNDYLLFARPVDLALGINNPAAFGDFLNEVVDIEVNSYGRARVGEFPGSDIVDQGNGDGSYDLFFNVENARGFEVMASGTITNFETSLRKVFSPDDNGDIPQTQEQDEPETIVVTGTDMFDVTISAFNPIDELVLGLHPVDFPDSPIDQMQSANPPAVTPGNPGGLRPRRGDVIQAPQGTVPVNFSWNPVAGATTYRVILFNLGTGKFIMNMTEFSSLVAPPVTRTLAPGKYSWSVQAVNAGGGSTLASAWTKQQQFTVIETLSVPVIVNVAITSAQQLQLTFASGGPGSTGQPPVTVVNAFWIDASNIGLGWQPLDGSDVGGGVWDFGNSADFAAGDLVEIQGQITNTTGIGEFFKFDLE